MPHAGGTFTFAVAAKRPSYDGHREHTFSQKKTFPATWTTGGSGGGVWPSGFRAGGR